MTAYKWTTKTGEQLSLFDMSTEHIRNALKLVERRLYYPLIQFNRERDLVITDLEKNKTDLFELSTELSKRIKLFSNLEKEIEELRTIGYR